MHSEIEIRTQDLGGGGIVNTIAADPRLLSMRAEVLMDMVESSDLDRAQLAAVVGLATTVRLMLLGREDLEIPEDFHELRVVEKLNVMSAPEVCDFCGEEVLRDAAGNWLDATDGDGCDWGPAGEGHDQVHMVWNPIHGIDPGPCVEPLDPDEDGVCQRCLHHVKDHG